MRIVLPGISFKDSIPREGRREVRTRAIGRLKGAAGEAIAIALGKG